MSKESDALESLIEKFSKVVMNETNIPQTKDNIDKCVDYSKQCFKDEINILKSALERKEKLEKALNIYKYKIVNPYLVKFYKTVEGYNANRTKTCYMYDELTETEFNLLKKTM